MYLNAQIYAYFFYFSSSKITTKGLIKFVEVLKCSDKLDNIILDLRGLIESKISLFIFSYDDVTEKIKDFIKGYMTPKKCPIYEVIK